MTIKKEVEMKLKQHGNKRVNQWATVSEMSG